MARYTETDLLLGVALGVVVLGAAVGRASAAPTPTGPSLPVPVPVPPAPVSGAPTPEQKAEARAMTLLPGHRYEAWIKTPDALAPFVTEQAIADQILRQTAMVVSVKRVDSTHWLASGVWAGPPTPIASLPPEVEWIREAP